MGSRWGTPSSAALVGQYFRRSVVPGWHLTCGSQPAHAAQAVAHVDWVQLNVLQAGLSTGLAGGRAS